MGENEEYKRQVSDVVGRLERLQAEVWRAMSCSVHVRALTDARGGPQKAELFLLMKHVLRADERRRRAQQEASDVVTMYVAHILVFTVGLLELLHVCSGGCEDTRPHTISLADYLKQRSSQSKETKRPDAPDDVQHAPEETYAHRLAACSGLQR